MFKRILRKLLYKVFENRIDMVSIETFVSSTEILSVNFRASEEKNKQEIARKIARHLLDAGRLEFDWEDSFEKKGRTLKVRLYVIK